jgi:hypothetical protein
VVGAVHAAGDDHRHRQLLHELRGEVVVRRALVPDLDRARVEGDPGHAGVLDQPLGDVDALGAQLDRDGQPRPLAGGAGDRDRLVGVLQQRRSRTGLHDLRDRAAHVDVEQVGADRRHVRGGGAHDLGVVAEQLDRHRPALALARVDHQQLVVRLLVAVVDGKAGDHLADRQARAVALGLQAHEPVADPGQRREHDPVRDRDAAQLPAVVQRTHAGKLRSLGCAPRSSGAPST